MQIIIKYSKKNYVKIMEVVELLPNILIKDFDSEIHLTVIGGLKKTSNKYLNALRAIRALRAEGVEFKTHSLPPIF